MRSLRNCKNFKLLSSFLAPKPAVPAADEAGKGGEAYRRLARVAEGQEEQSASFSGVS